MEERREFTTYVEKQLTGFKLENDTLLGKQPLERFFTGLLFPIMSEDALVEDLEDYTNDPDANEVTQIQSIGKTQRYMPPSSVGFSFFISGNDIKLRVYHKASSFKKNKDTGRKIQSWKKTLLADDGKEIELRPNSKKRHIVLSNKAEIDVLWRPYNDGYIVTLTLSNQQRIFDSNIDGKEFIKQRNEKTLFEVEFKCIVELGEVADYPATEKSLLDTEEREIQLRYQELKACAVGHGVAANWQNNLQGDMEIWADFMPKVEVPQVTADTGGDDNKVLEFYFLQHDDSFDKLENFVHHYEQWIKLQEEKSSNESDLEIAKNIIKNLDAAKQRMQQGVKLLKENNNAKTAFMAMNKAMLMQWQQGDKNKGSVKEKSSYRWRPFQLAFILMTLKSSIDENDEYRDTLDLIWFPTGGGKTEAYLGLMAFLFIYRRLKAPASGSGTVAIMRYTLRLLTAQQFVRANKVIFALDLIRQENKHFGSEPFSSGLWVGRTTSPNRFKDALEYIEDNKLEKFVINSCPWCDTKFKRQNYRATDDGFNFYCTNNDCDFGKIPSKPLPCNVVDEALYANPPSLLIATVDKFARLCWESRANSFFGGKCNKPPELIIQDELHLISDALGSIVGLYEAGIETALIARGVRVKYIASTATIKNAKQQVKSLFAKETKIFPPSGLRYDDSYFAKTIPLNEKPGRMYVGYLAPLPSRENSLSPLAATLLSAPTQLFKDKEELIDNWWTQIIYHGSLKGLGNSSTLYQSSISSRLSSITLENIIRAVDSISPNFCHDENIKTIDDFQKITNPEIKQIVDKYLPVRELNLKELSSKRSAEENAQIFNALALEKFENESIDVALATNMVATGLDVQRLALMVINGQPLTTAEYIQASSRVGRGKTPGIVFVNYYKTQARSLSHYENFRSYHEGFYRFVEPSSLTPFTYQARRRALHSAIVVAIRHSGIGLLDNNNAGNFDKNNDKVKKVIKELKIRCKNAIDNSDTQKQTVMHIDGLLNEWQAEKEYCDKNRVKMVFYETDRGSQNLICNFDQKNGRWQTLQSMRNVEKSALVKLIPGLKRNEE